MAIRRCPADKAFSDAIRFYRAYRCEHCQTQNGKMEAAHIFGRANKAVRWDVMNILCLCFRCHLHFTGNPLEFTAWLERYLGEGHLEILNEKRRRIQKDTKAYRKEVAAHYRQQLRLMEAGPHELVSFQ